MTTEASVPPNSYTQVLHTGCSNDTPVVVSTSSLSGERFPRDVHRQALRCVEIIKGAVAALGGKMESIVRTHRYLSEADLRNDVARSHEACVGANPPACTMVVSPVILEEILVEIEADFYLPTQ